MLQSEFVMGFQALQVGRWPEAIAAFRAALAQQPDWAEAHYNLGNAYIGTA